VYNLTEEDHYETVLFACVLTLISFFIIGCSSGKIIPVEPTSQVDPVVSERETDSQRVLWGIWNLAFDPVEMEVVVEPVRNVEAHFNIRPLATDTFSSVISIPAINFNGCEPGADRRTSTVRMWLLTHPVIHTYAACSAT